MGSVGLTLAVEKTQAVVFTDWSKRFWMSPLVVGERTVDLSGAMRYLGLTMDRSLSYRDYVREATGKAARIMESLAWLLQNMGGGSGEYRGHLYVNVIHSVLLYDAST